MKNFKRNGVIVLLISIVLMYFILRNNFNESINILLSSKIIWIIISIITYIIYLVLESVVTKILINQYDKNYTLTKTINLTLMTKFFNGVTPFATGGQPLQVYELKKEGIRITDGTTIMVEHFLIFQLTIVIMALISILINTIFKVVDASSFLNLLAILGFTINIVLLLIVFLMARSKTINKKIFSGIIKFLYKIKIIKNKEKTLNNFDKSCNDFYQSYKLLAQNKKLVFKLIIIEMISLTIWFVMPIFIFKSLNYTGSLNALICILISTYIFFVGSYVPIPGGSGGMEYAYIGYFTLYINNTYLSSSLILWRLLNYYLPMIVGGLVFNLRKQKEEIKS